MAYGNFITVGWVNAWNNGYYKVDNYVYYAQDLTNRKLKVRIANQRCCSLNSKYYFFNNNGVNNGYGFQSMGGGVIDVNDPVNVPAGGCWIHSGDRNVDIEVSYNKDGTVPTVNMSTQFISGTGVPNAPEFNWITKDISSSFPEISAIPDPPSAPTNLTATNITYNYALLGWGKVSGAVSYDIEIITGSSTPVESASDIETNQYNAMRLAENTNYKFRVRSHDSYGQTGSWSSYKSFTTAIDQAKVKINVGGVAKTGKVFVNVSGSAKKVKKIYVNVNGQAKEVV